ncbi:hypothetical protein NUW58_g2481 [Xylaria curta]|uniref:Uncharacterized protein n=1 Tax=Xylaria curta TaxID=42375 RepID=A0ACC1PFB9_9PEZI|nr:hypothetical protein NUW58_g2481 [Xylaria curta]
MPFKVTRRPPLRYWQFTPGEVEHFTWETRRGEKQHQHCWIALSKATSSIANPYLIDFTERPIAYASAQKRRWVTSGGDGSVLSHLLWVPSRRGRDPEHDGGRVWHMQRGMITCVDHGGQCYFGAYGLRLQTGRPPPIDKAYKRESTLTFIVYKRQIVLKSTNPYGLIGVVMAAHLKTMGQEHHSPTKAKKEGED